MKKIVAFFQAFRLRQLVSVMLASVFVVLSTACSNAGPLSAISGQGRPEVPSDATSSQYKGGMNDFSDVDPRFDQSEASAKAKALKDNAERNIKTKSIDSPEEFVDNFKSGAPIQERTKNILDSTAETAKNLQEDVAKGTERGAENLKANTSNAVDQTASATQRKADEVGQSVESASRSAAKATERTAQDASDLARYKTNEAAKTTQRALEDATSAS